MGVIEGLKTLILFAAGEDNVEPLKEGYIRFAKSTPHKKIKFLCDNTAIQITALDKDEFKKVGFQKKWDATKHSEHYIKSLDDFVE